MLQSETILGSVIKDFAIGSTVKYTTLPKITLTIIDCETKEIPYIYRYISDETGRYEYQELSYKQKIYKCRVLANKYFKRGGIKYPKDCLKDAIYLFDNEVLKQIH